MATEKLRNVRVDRGPKNLSSQVIASTDLFKIQPIFMRETKANDKWSIKHHQLNICDALSVPSFVDVKCRNTWFYVPYCKLWQPFESFLGGTTITINNSPYKFDKVPTISPLAILAVFGTKGWYTVATTAPSSYDFRYSLGNDNTKFGYCTFTAKGRRIWNVLQGLGYRYQLFVDSDSNDNVVMPTLGPSISALPLLAYFKIFGENFVPSKYYDNINELISAIYNFEGDWDVTSATYYTDHKEFTYSNLTGPTSSDMILLQDILDILGDVFYGDDYFTSSPAESMASPDGLNSDDVRFDITVPTGASNYSTTVDSKALTDYTPTHRGLYGGMSSNQPTNVSDYIHNMLHLLTKNIQLKALAGSKLAQRLYALYGTKSNTYNMEAVIIDQNVSRVEVKSITSVADTESGSTGAALGQKGGQMNDYAEKSIHAEFTEFGALICVNQIIPTYFYGQGLHREMMHIRRDDFYNDRYALAGYQNIARFELFADDYLGYYKKSSITQKGSFGKTSPYAEYALRKDALIGDFATLSRMLGTDAYHYNRFLVDQLSDMSNDVAIASLPSLPSNNEQFMRVVKLNSSDPDINHQYDRIFTDANASDDHIAQWNDFVISAVRDGRNINDFTIGEEDGSMIELDGLGHVLYN